MAYSIAISGSDYEIRGINISRNVWGGVISGFGLLFAVLELVYMRGVVTPLGILIEGVVPLLGAAGLVIAGYTLWARRYTYNDEDVPRVVTWTTLGMSGMTVIYLWNLSHHLIYDNAVFNPESILINYLIAGALTGFVIGTYDAQSQTYQRSLQQEKRKHAFLNRELRHHVLNSMTVILGQLDTLDQDALPSEEIATIRRHCNEITDRVQSVRRIARAFTDQGTSSLSRQDLSAVISDVVAIVADQYEEAVISTDIPKGVTVAADKHLAAVFENLLANAIEHNDTTPYVQISVTTDGETARVRITDNGPGIADDRKESLFEWDEPPAGETETELGLAIVKVLVDRYNGAVWLEDNDLRGTVVVVELTQLPRETSR